MSARNFLLLMAICLVWGLNVVVTRWVVANLGVPPIFFAALRFGLVGLVLVGFLRPIPEKFGILALIALFMGALHFGFLFAGLSDAAASSAAVVGQLGVPFSTLLSIIFLGERVGWRRGLGIALAFAGVLVIAVDPDDLSFSYGLILIAISAFVGAVGGALMKRLPPISPLRMQAWIGLMSAPLLLAFSTLVETGGPAAALEAGWPFAAATAFAVIGVSIFGHGAFYFLLKRHDLSLISPLTLMTPMWSVFFGIVLLDEPFTLKLLIGAAVSLTGVLVIALRPNRKLPTAALADKISDPT